RAGVIWSYPCTSRFGSQFCRHCACNTDCAGLDAINTTRNHWFGRFESWSYCHFRRRIKFTNSSMFARCYH
ncbi:unnamed protein product, partial [Sphacelaria rigidula]